MEKLYVTTQSSRRFIAVKVINIRTNRVLSITPIGDLGRGHFAGKPLPKSNGIVYVLSGPLLKRGGQIVFFVINTNTRRTIKTIPLGTKADIWQYVLTPNEHRLWFTDRTANSVKVINTHTNQIIHDIYVPRPTFISPTRDGKYIWVMSEQGGITVIRTRTKKIVGSIKVPFGPFVFSPDGEVAYVGITNAAKIRVPVINVQTAQILRTIRVNSVGGIEGIFITPGGGRLVLNTEGALTIINPHNSKLLAVRTDIIPDEVFDHQIFSRVRDGVAIRRINALNVIKTIPVKDISGFAVTDS